MKKDDVKKVTALGKFGEKLLHDHIIYDNPGKTTEEHLRKHLIDKLSAGENLDSEQVRFLMDSKPETKKVSDSEMWEIYKTTGTGRERAAFKRVEKKDQKRNQSKPFVKQPTLKDKPTRKPGALPPGTGTIKVDPRFDIIEKEVNQILKPKPFDLEKYIKEKADEKLKAEQNEFDSKFIRGGIAELKRPV